MALMLEEFFKYQGMPGIRHGLVVTMPGSQVSRFGSHIDAMALDKRLMTLLFD